MSGIILSNLAIMLGIFTVVWVLSIAIRNASIVDILWGPACALPAFLTWVRTDGYEPRALILTFLVALWGLRLGFYLARRNIGHGEDYRYVAMRKKAGGDGPFRMISLVRVFWLQCLISFFVSLPTQVGQFGVSPFLLWGSEPLGVLAWLGIAVFAVGFLFETVGDAQLRAFKSKPENKGRLMTEGLWAWTRHPNYFGDAAVWTGLTLIALESQWGFVTVLSPALMIFFLYAVSGKALLERAMVRKYPEYESYKKRTSGFFPRPPKRL
ncbi:DUF1295 domain-containing protein [Parvularcula lutaonensis]|uniref:DUF1295 domain-containing protein n=1 Tax=Parvularcula lutaonensis TaxID=491923 RepID=A0ABV7MAJ1_9PROT|nr:DUF1295 domain-containing protein [Parvularcula lutaonensis]GGY37847.1 membrane protein [Parvularcula lutaonensis]